MQWLLLQPTTLQSETLLQTTHTLLCMQDSCKQREVTPQAPIVKTLLKKEVWASLTLQVVHLRHKVRRLLVLELWAPRSKLGMHSRALRA